MKKSLLFLFAFVCWKTSPAQEIDVLHYEYRLTLSDETDEIRGEATITVRFLKVVDRFSLDLVSKTAGKGMTVTRVAGSVGVRHFTQGGEKLTLVLNSPAVKEDTLQFYIVYRGIPADGLIISKNKYGERTFFADNWPDRARHWIPCNDRPDDKAAVDFYVALPRHYQVVANGRLENDSVKGDWTDEARSNGDYYHWKETVPIPTKVMVIGAARFAVKEFNDSPPGIPVSAWVYPQDSTKGFYDYALAVPILKFFQGYIGEYPFEKLANVQSKTMFGGMENASCIFYSEASVNGKRTAEALIAHEIVHQWFGNSATEKHFAHIWLSEGFAKHLTNVYLGHIYGEDTVKNRLRSDREKVITFLKKDPLPVVDSSSELMDLLNANSYEKGGWVLRMIQAEVGDTVFQKIIRQYYQTYRGSNAETKDFQKIVEGTTGRNWEKFFRQWLFRAGLPQIDAGWKQKQDKVEITLRQQGFVYELPIEFEIRMEDGRSFFKKEVMNSNQLLIDAFVDGKVKEIIIDPHVKLLAELRIL